jgi:hypothetical protein
VFARAVGRLRSQTGLDSTAAARQASDDGFGLSAPFIASWSAPGGEIVHPGFAGVSCVEAGGPASGIGCTGCGILSAFDLLEQLEIASCRYDLALCDVLGDVVCGGIAVPLCHDYAQVIYIVTSGEFMALYARNNIRRSKANWSADSRKRQDLLMRAPPTPSQYYGPSLP